jgi:hypothetical protein
VKPNPAELSLECQLDFILELTQLQTEALDNDEYEKLRDLTRRKQEVLEACKASAPEFAIKATRDTRRKIQMIGAMEKYNLRLGLWKEQACGAALSKSISGRAALNTYHPQRTQGRILDKAL